MAIEWPAGVNKKIYDYVPNAPKFPIVKDESDIGNDKRRLRSTKARILHDFRMIFDVKSGEWQTFQVWYATNLKGGVLSFNFDFSSYIIGFNGDTSTIREVRATIDDNGAGYMIDNMDRDIAIIRWTLEEI
jgi:hypothetical protein